MNAATMNDGTSSRLSLRDARREDAEVLWRWTQDPEVRKVSSSPRPIPWEEHLRWLEERISSPDAILLVGRRDEEPFGVVRFERNGREAVVSISLAAEHRGKGWGRWILAEGVREMRARWPETTAVAYVWKSNQKSLRLFAGRGFVPSAGAEDQMERFVLAPDVHPSGGPPGVSGADAVDAGPREAGRDALALQGGRPVRGQWLPYARQTLGAEDIAAVVEVLEGAWITQGPKVAEFERAVAGDCGAKCAVAFSNGTAALHAACAAADIGPGDEAVTTPLTFAATANAVVYCGGTPRFADVRPDTLNIDPERAERAVTDRTRALLPVDFAGQPADLDPLMDIARRNGLLVIEDAAHALGGRYRGRPIGSVADMTVLSFHPVKHITTGEGGMVLTDDPRLEGRLRVFRHHGMERPFPDRPWRYEISRLGFNYRITDIQCALGLSQLARAGERLARREALAGRYRERLMRSPFLTLPAVLDEVRHAWHIFVVLLNLEALAADRDEVMRALHAENIGAQLHYPLAHLHPYYRRTFGYGEGLCPVAESLFPRLLTLPLFPAMTDSDQDDVLAALEKVFAHFGDPNLSRVE